MEAIIDKAIKYSARAHNNQFRKGSDIPYISHPFAVAWILKEANATDDQIVAGLLHDVVEDTEITIEEIEAEFGHKIAKLVEACSEFDPKANWESRKKHTHETLRNAPAEVRLIACADKLHNLRSISLDYDLTGDKVWSKFGRGKESQSWHYLELADILCDDLENYSEGSIFHQFREEVNHLFKHKLLKNQSES